ncbi:MAG: BMP family ABC transporter substrate-binding protein [Treponema sp.]|nr:BMP family ABC transporter substrate-binding protein [Treponema sp.]
MKKIYPAGRIITVLLLLCFLITLSCERKSALQEKDGFSILVFITGIIIGNPYYELLAEGAAEFARDNPKVNIKVYEAGVNQALWEQQLAEMVYDGGYDIVIGANPSLPEICINVGRMFADQKFIILDAHLEGNPQIRTYQYNQYEQSLFLGYLAGLITTSDMSRINSQKKIGFIAAQEYPLLTGYMVPGFIEGAKLVDPQIELDFRVIGSWADANKAAELADAMINSGVDVFTAIAGLAAQGMIKVLADRGAYAVWYNTNAYNMAPGVIVGCGIMEQKKLVMEILKSALAGEIQYGISDSLGVKEGYLGFIFDDPAYRDLPSGVRQRFEKFLDEYFQE